MQPLASGASNRFHATYVVEAAGREVENFKPGDAVFYAGSIARPGTSSEHQLADERIVGVESASLSRFT